ncbi:hypothetical protein SAMN05421819_3563 [Bryocella elongata]|uniref:Phage gp6-like head-tail connector protein n=1 Tax=Bryocella elongata TaxID=863522 RepID=A0A1H6B661_9BACT|nr:hypothetical protein [Bryocella elongata]SEG56341.1 hypothetical protein SAMN05421819_3563 [Bryocella elongata]
MATGDLITIEQLKAWNGKSDAATDFDSAMGDAITATSADFLRAIDRFDFLAADYTEVREGDGGTHLSLRHWPINSVAALTVAGTAVSASPDGIAAGYSIVQQPDPERLRDIFFVGGSTMQDGAAVSVTYNAGYATPPADVVQAVLEWVSLRWRGRPGTGITSQRDAGGEHVTYDAQAPAPPSALDVIERYKRSWPNYNKRQDDRDYRVTRINRTMTEKLA